MNYERLFGATENNKRSFIRLFIQRAEVFIPWR